MTNATDRVVIVGAGLAGDRCAFALREAGYQGQIILIGAEPIRPYDRPPLSKAVLKEVGAEHAIFFRPECEYHKAAITLFLGRSVASLRPCAREIVLEGGESLSYDRLVLATGSRVRTLPFLPQGARNVFYLRNYADALALRTALDKGGRAVVVGGGVIGLEVAAIAASRGLSVTVVEPQARLMSRAVGSTIADVLSRKHAMAGVQLRCGVGVTGVESGAEGYSLTLSDHQRVSADFVIVGVGVLPDVTLAEAAGLDVTTEGIIVDGHGRTSCRDVFAAGEVAFYYNDRLGRHERQETWFHAAAHGEHVGRSMIAPGAPYQEINTFWTDQYEMSLQSIGLGIGERDVVRGDISNGRFVVFHMIDGVIVGASGVNAPSELRQAKALIVSGAKVDVMRLADPNLKVSAAAIQAA